jgi:hypothetical protein
MREPDVMCLGAGTADGTRETLRALWSCTGVLSARYLCLWVGVEGRGWDMRWQGRSRVCSV